MFVYIGVRLVRVCACVRVSKNLQECMTIFYYIQDCMTRCRQIAGFDEHLQIK